MRTTVDLDRRTVAAAMKATGTTTMRAAIQLALNETIRRRRQKALIALRGTFRHVPTAHELERMRAE